MHEVICKEMSNNANYWSTGGFSKLEVETMFQPKCTNY